MLDSEPDREVPVSSSVCISPFYKPEQVARQEGGKVTTGASTALALARRAQKLLVY